MTKSEDEILKQYCNLNFPEFKPEDYELVLNTFNFQNYLLQIRKQELREAIIDSLPMIIRKYFKEN